MNEAQRELAEIARDCAQKLARQMEINFESHSLPIRTIEEIFILPSLLAAYARGAAAARDEVIERFSRKYAHALWDTYCLCETMDDPFRSAAHVVIDEINFRATGHHFDAEAIRAGQEQGKVKP